jgi:hypothetical protein
MGDLLQHSAAAEPTALVSAEHAVAWCEGRRSVRGEMRRSRRPSSSAKSTQVKLSQDCEALVRNELVRQIKPIFREVVLACQVKCQVSSQVK